MKAVVAGRFQLGEGPSRGLLRDYEPSDGPSFQALVIGPRVSRVCPWSRRPDTNIIFLIFSFNSSDFLKGSFSPAKCTEIETLLRPIISFS